MIRRLLTTFAITLVMLFGTLRAAHADTRIAYVDVDTVLGNSLWAKKQLGDAQTARDKQMEPFKKLQADLTKQAVELQKQGGSMKADELKRKTDELEAKKKQLLEKVMELDKLYADAVAKIRNEIVKRVKVAAAMIVKEGKYDYCLDASVVFAGPLASDVTKDVTTRVDAMK